MEKIFKTKDGKQFSSSSKAFEHELSSHNRRVVIRLHIIGGGFNGRKYATLYLVGKTGDVVEVGYYGEGMDYRNCSVEDAYKVGRKMAIALRYEFNEVVSYE